MKEFLVVDFDQLIAKYQSNKQSVLGNIKNNFRVINGNKIKSIEFSEGTFYLWMHYYSSLLEVNKEIGNRIMYNLIVDFDQLIKKDKNYIYNASTKRLEVKKDFSDKWIRESIFDVMHYISKDKEGSLEGIKEQLSKVNSIYKRTIRLNIK